MTRLSVCSHGASCNEMIDTPIIVDPVDVTRTRSNPRVSSLDCRLVLFQNRLNNQ